MATRKGNTSKSKRRGNPDILDHVEKEVEGFYNKITSRIPGSKFSQASELAARFHGRENRGVRDIEEEEHYHANVAVLGELEELQILCHDGKSIVPISFKPDDSQGESSEGEDFTVYLVASPDGKQLEFVGGDQELEFTEQTMEALEIVEDDLDKQYVNVGPIYCITYFADKHHLTGPKQQADGMQYEHEFGEEGGSMPELIYDTVNGRCLIVGGSYEIRDEGIWN